jgi:hypothetical protein
MHIELLKLKQLLQASAALASFSSSFAPHARRGASAFATHAHRSLSSSCNAPLPLQLLRVSLCVFVCVFVCVSVCVSRTAATAAR